MKYFFSLLFTFLSLTIYSQLALINLDDDTPIVDGDSFLFDTTVFEDAKLKFQISNSSTTETINVLAEMVSFTNSNGSNLQFCVNPECYFDVAPGSTIPTNPIVLAPGENNGDFDYFSNSNSGDGITYPMTYTIRFFMLDGSGNEVGDDITITYLYDPEPLSTSDFQLRDLGIILESTILRDNITITASEVSKVELFDISGKKTNTFKISSGRNNFDVSNLNSGIIIAKFISAKGRIAVTKLVKQ